MRILGIETSCDETAACVIEATGTIASHFSFSVRGNALYSQIEKHRPYGGVFPNLAKREHAKNLVPILFSALKEAEMITPARAPTISKADLDEIKTILEREPELFSQLVPFFAQYEKPPIDAIAVTYGPGLEPALWVGVNFARTLSHAWSIPVVSVNHMEGHVVIAAIKESTLAPLTFPALALLISGGHTEIVLMKEWFSYEKIGQTRDDAVGEAFDKAARLLGLPYPGGPEISRLAKKAREQNILPPFPLPRPMEKSGDLDFSFSGLKTAVRRSVELLGTVTDAHKLGIAREFEDAVADVLVAKTRDAVLQTGARAVLLGGGVAANHYIGAKLQAMLAEEFEATALFVCPPIQATDNALMIALAGYFRALRNEFTDPTTMRANGNLKLS